MSSGLFRPIHLALGEMREKCSKTMSKLPYLPNTLSCRSRCGAAHGAAPWWQAGVRCWMIGWVGGMGGGEMGGWVSERMNRSLDRCAGGGRAGEMGALFELVGGVC